MSRIVINRLDISVKNPI